LDIGEIPRFWQGDARNGAPGVFYGEATGQR
jgi:hypothetical protein